ncbi:MAG: RluA family pseudouridine synthase [Fibrobacterota bacterium]
MIVSTVIDQNYEGMRIDAYLALKYTYFSRSAWRKNIGKGIVFVNRKIIKPSYVLKNGDSVEYDRDISSEPFVDRNIEIIYDDDCLTVVNKSGNLPVHASGKYFNNTMTALLREKYGFGDVHLINRIDRETSGIVLIGKTAEYAAVFQKLFSEKSIEKKYTAVVHGEIRESEFVIDRPLGPRPDSLIRNRQYVTNNGLPSITQFRLLGNMDGYSLLECMPVTGRTNQIRAHLCSIGHTIAGDKLYGDPEAYLAYIENRISDEEYLGGMSIHRQALHCGSMNFRHPFTGEDIEIRAPLPTDIRGLIIKSGGEGLLSLVP